jgi:hypothetical protein
MCGKAGWALLAALILVAGEAEAQCTKDTDCKGDRVCEAGKCTAPAPSPEAATAAESPAAESPAAESPVAESPVAESPVAGRPQPVAPAERARPPVIEAEPPPPAPEPKTRRRSRGSMVAGIVMVSTGPIALLGALAARNSQKNCDDAIDADYPDHRLPSSERYRVDECNGYSVPIYVLGIGGALLTTVGIPLIIYGAKSLPDERPSGSLVLQPWASPTAGGVRLRLTL